MNWKKLYRISPYVVCFVACAVINLFYFPPNTIFPDERRFLISATKLAISGEFWVGPDRAWEMPGTAFFFAPWVWLLGPHGSIIAIRFCQSLLLCTQCGMVSFLVRHTSRDKTAAFIATYITAIYPFFLFYQGLLLSETLFNTLLLASLAMLYWWRERGARIDGTFVIVCACFAAATLTKATLTILPPLLIAATVWTTGAAVRRTAGMLLVAGCVYAAFMSPWWIRNFTLLGTFVPFTTSSAQNLYLGNNPKNQHAGNDWAVDVDSAVAGPLLKMPDEVARQRAFSQNAISYIKAHPTTFIRAAGAKFVRFWNVIPNTNDFRGIYAFVSAITFGPVLLLALIGSVRQRKKWQDPAPIFIVITYFTLVHIVTIASLRYRLPLESLLIVLAAEPIAVIVSFIRQNAPRCTPPKTIS